MRLNPAGVYYQDASGLAKPRHSRRWQSAVPLARETSGKVAAERGLVESGKSMSETRSAKLVSGEGGRGPSKWESVSVIHAAIRLRSFREEVHFLGTAGRREIGFESQNAPKSLQTLIGF
jgi:hypothetical protein